MTRAVNSEAKRRLVLTLGCPDRPGIIAEITRFIAEDGSSIHEAGYHSDEDSGWFFTRQAVLPADPECTPEIFAERFAPVAQTLGPDVEWAVHDTTERKRIVLLVSKEPHCLHDLLGRAAAGDFPATIEAIIGNHEDLRGVAEAHGVKFHHVPFPANPAERGPAFEQVRDLADSYLPDAIVLARFMQVLPEDLCRHWSGRAINIHHSFLPSFVGARPYHQAYARGVKLIGATCHYVTAELDAGPIIEQDVIRIDHSFTVRDIVRQGRDAEKLVLARGLRWHLEDRVLVHGRKTVVFT
ncbi:MAG: formyltetrahydrofolate deformylase [Nocardiaceae bacterium]|nr:formyltetrahydrofolate deformylase [Nocardiaceae bacterium]